MKNYHSTQKGFTLIEMIVSLAVFSTVITIAVGALLMLIGTNQRLQDEQTVMTNLSFALDSMTREIRTGTNYYCLSDDDIDGGGAGQRIFEDGEDLDFSPTQDCVDGNNDSSPRRYHGMSFVESGQSITEVANTRIAYFVDLTSGIMYRRISGQAAEQITSSGLEVVHAEFFVTGSTRLVDGGAGADKQPTVTIVLEARDRTSESGETYHVQTTVTQRSADL
tara:strand:+ start:2520 stop:3185 length:666 start_codon:yes stop_codon:yes gene_type:complete